MLCWDVYFPLDVGVDVRLHLWIRFYFLPTWIGDAIMSMSHMLLSLLGVVIVILCFVVDEMCALANNRRAFNFENNHHFMCSSILYSEIGAI